jgi:hypothetical protein
MARILRLSLRLSAAAVALLVIVTLAYGEGGVSPAPTSSASAPQTVLDVLQQMSGQADVVFTGQVVAVRQPQGAGVVEVEFQVDQAIRGCSAGTPYILREWAGLWSVGVQRYRVGQRLLMLLHAPSAAGMSSPVGGLDGAIPIRQGGTVSLVSMTPPPPPFVDLRWLGARIPRTVSYRKSTAHAAGADATSKLAVSGAVVSATAGTTVVVPISGSADPSEASVPAQQASVDAVVGMLTTWQKAQHVAP